MPTPSFYRPKFFDFMRDEYLACRESVGIIDISSFSKIEIKSPGQQAVNYLQRLCSNDVDIAPGSIVQTAMLNEQGGYENDCLMVRQAENSFFMVSPSSQQTRIYSWMSKNLQPSDGTVHLDDVTSMYTVINVVGPKASLLLSELSNSDINFQPFTSKKINIAYASEVLVMSFTHTGEPGYCLYVPSEYALHVYDRLMYVGRDYGAKDVGTLTQRFMRIERFIPFWAEELTSFVTPFEAGMGSYVHLKKNGDFIGKEVMLRQKTTGVHRRLCMFQVEDLDAEKDIWPWGGEPLYRNGKFVGVVTSVGYGFTTDRLVCLGFIKRVEGEGEAAVGNEYITNDYILDDAAEYCIDVAGKLFKLTPYLHAPVHAHETKQKSKAGKYRPTVVSIKK
jgi:pyruvate dehydrogenase phosphatase regulatory subunit